MCCGGIGESLVERIGGTPPSIIGICGAVIGTCDEIVIGAWINHEIHRLAERLGGYPWMVARRQQFFAVSFAAANASSGTWNFATKDFMHQIYR